MNPSGSGEPAVEDSVLRAWTELGADADRSGFVTAHPELCSLDTVEALCLESHRLAKSDLEKAMKWAQAARALAELQTPPKGRGRALRALANVTHLQGRYHEAAELYATALEHFRGHERRLDEAVTRSSALQNLIYLGDFDRARQWAGTARRIFEELGDQLRLARLDLNYANILHRKDRWDEALELYQSADAAFRKLGAVEDLAACLSNQATCLISLNRFFQALQVYKQARQLCFEQDWPLMVAEVDYNIAHLYFLRGDYTRALEQYQVARKHAGANGDQLHLGLCDLDQSEIYIELNLVDEAVTLASRAYERFVLLGLRNEAAKALVHLAVGNSRQGKTFLALDFLAKARDILSGEGNEIWPAVIDLYRALLFFSEGRSFEAARLARSARGAFEAASITSKSAACEVLLAKIARDSGDFKAALDASEAALARLRSLNLPALSCEAHLVEGQAREALGHRDEAMSAYQAARGWLERTSGHRQPEDLKIPLAGDRLLVYEALVSMNMEGALEGAASKQFERVFSLAEKAKARNLAHLIAFRASSLPAKATSRSALVGDIRSLREELNWYYRQIDVGQLAAEAETRGRIGSLRETSRKQEQKLIRTLSEVGLQDREFGLLQDAATAGVEEVQRVLPAGTALLEYFVARGSIFAILLTSESLEARPVSLVSRTQDLHRDLQFQLSRFLTGEHDGAGGTGLSDAGTLRSLKGLYDELAAPLLERLDSSRIVIVPHAHLHSLPFHALFDGAHFLGDRYSVSYAPSAAAFYQARLRKRAAENRVVLLDAAGTEPSRLSSLVAAFEPLGASVELLEGERAGRDSLLEVGSARILHLAVGARHRQDNPMFTSLEFADSALSLFDLYGLECSADLVVVTGCGADLEILTQGDEFVALANGLLYAGAKTVVLNLWNPDPLGQIGLWEGFYARIAAGSRPATALSEAVAAHRMTNPHPFEWAPVVLSGDPA